MHAKLSPNCSFLLDTKGKDFMLPFLEKETEKEEDEELKSQKKKRQRKRKRTKEQKKHQHLLKVKKRLESDINEVQKEKICLKCQNKREVMFFPCRHLCTCSECSEIIKICPICQTLIDKRVRVYQN